MTMTKNNSETKACTIQTPQKQQVNSGDVEGYESHAAHVAPNIRLYPVISHNLEAAPLQF